MNQEFHGNRREIQFISDSKLIKKMDMILPQKNYIAMAVSLRVLTLQQVW